MLTEHFIASTGAGTKASGPLTGKDAGIFIHEFQPLLGQRSTFKKSATPPNSLAISESHIFAAQADKAVVNVYSRSQGNHEATVPFPERITCLALACDDTVLVSGTAEGRLFLWETSSGRQISTSQSHLQSVKRVVVDPTQNFLLSASEDSTVHVWSLPSLLSFSSSGIQAPAPINTFTSHRSPITALELGHGADNFAVSTSNDKTCLIWDYTNNNILRTYLLPSVPTSLTLDAADRAIYVGYEDGSVQQLGLFTTSSKTAKGLASDAATSAPIQPSESSRWHSSDRAIGSALALDISFDGCTLLSGHDSGNILAWDAAKGGFGTALLQTPLPGPANNLQFLPVTGFSGQIAAKMGLGIAAVVKPKFGAFDSASGAVPGNYTQHVQLTGDLSSGLVSAFTEALHARSFPDALLDEGLQELASWHHRSQTNGVASHSNTDDFMALDEPDQPRGQTLEEQNAALKAEIEALRRLQSASFDKMERINSEKKALMEREQKRLRKLNSNGKAAMNDTSSSDE